MYFPPETGVVQALSACRRITAGGLLLLAAVSHAQQISLTVDDVSGGGFAAQGIRAEYRGGTVDIHLDAVKLGTRSWKQVKLDCAALKQERARISCNDGAVALPERIPLSFHYQTDKRELDLALKPASDESWQLSVRPAVRGNDLSVRIHDGRLQRVAGWLPLGLPKVTAGTARGTLTYGGDGQIAVQLLLKNAAFADATGLHAGEKLGLTVDGKAMPAKEGMRWEASLAWSEGEVFWQPLYLKAAQQQLAVAGTLDDRRVKVDRGTLRFPAVGDASFSGTYDLAASKLVDGQASTQEVAVPALYETLLKPFLAESSFADLRTEGRASAAFVLNEKGLQRVDVTLAGISFEDKTQRRFALFDISGNVPWRADAPTQAAVTIKGGELLKMPVGSFALPLGMNGMRFDLKQLRVPLLDGHIDVRDFAARAGASGWYWQFSGDVSAISMQKLTTALGVPAMHGTLAAAIPMVRHIKSSLRVDGALSLKVFDGSIEAKNLVLLDLFGKAPRVQADVVMQNLDLGLVTRTYSFGNIAGRMDVRLDGLELVNWQPVKFDAQLASSPGDYPRRISQTAVQNISALGGAGAVAALQRSVLRVFDEFGYDKLGWRCRLQNGVCEMSGVEDAAPGYVLVKGGGIPSITVMGYNRRVSWQELLDRLKRVTQSNVKPVVK